MNIEEISSELLACTRSFDYFAILDKWISSLTMDDIKIGKIKYKIILGEVSGIESRATINVQGIVTENHCDWYYNNESTYKFEILAFSNLLNDIFDEFQFIRNYSINISQYEINNSMMFKRKSELINNITKYNILKDFKNVYETKFIKIYNSDKYKSLLDDAVKEYIQKSVGTTFKDIMSIVDTNIYNENNIEELIVKALAKARIARILE